MNVIERIEAEQIAEIEAKRVLPDFEQGDTVRVLVRVSEGNRTRTQAYEGVCIARSGGGLNQSFTVRKISNGEGVERVFPLFSPLVEGVEIVRRGRVRRAKLYYLRGRRGKSARIAEDVRVRARKREEAEKQARSAAKAEAEASRKEPPAQPESSPAEAEAVAEATSGEVISGEAPAAEQTPSE